MVNAGRHLLRECQSGQQYLPHKKEETRVALLGSIQDVPSLSFGDTDSAMGQQHFLDGFGTLKIRSPRENNPRIMPDTDREPGSDDIAISTDWCIAYIYLTPGYECLYSEAASRSP